MRASTSERPWLFWGLVAVGIVVIGVLALIPASTLGAARVKLSGRGALCGWDRVLTMEDSIAQLSAIRGSLSGSIAVEDNDSELGIVKVRSPTRSFWIKQSGTAMDGPSLLHYLIAEHVWMLKMSPNDGPRAGDVVIDCGAHVGTFVDEALSLGVSKVIAVEPDPIHIECLRRNFAQEIADGRVVLVPKGVWSEPGTMQLTLASENSGMNSLARGVDGQSVEVPVTTIDQIVADLGLTRVDYLKMDIEGAEKHALTGASDTLSQFRPRLMLESNSSAEGVVEPEFVKNLDNSYEVSLGPCALAKEMPLSLIPYVIYYF